MIGNIDDMQKVIRDAEATLRTADSLAEAMARLLVGRLRKVGSSSVLSRLKRELKDYNIHTGSWKE